MNNESCKTCFYGDRCAAGTVCEDYTPIYETGDAAIERHIENGRREFVSDWWQYIGDYE